jgi:hypothetical protein
MITAVSDRWDRSAMSFLVNPLRSSASCPTARREERNRDIRHLSQCRQNVLDKGVQCRTETFRKFKRDSAGLLSDSGTQAEQLRDQGLANPHPRRP